MNIKGADQTARMRRLISAFVVRIRCWSVPLLLAYGKHMFSHGKAQIWTHALKTNMVFSCLISQLLTYARLNWTASSEFGTYRLCE